MFVVFDFDLAEKLLQLGKGILRVMLGDGKAGADIIPVDMAVSLIITVAWSTAMERLVFTEKYYKLLLYIDVYVFVYIFLHLLLY